MSDARGNLLTRGMRWGDSISRNGISFGFDGDWYHVSGTATKDIGYSAYYSTDMPVEPGKTYTLSIDFDGDVPSGYRWCSLQLFTDAKRNKYIDVGDIYRDQLHVTFTVPDGDYEVLQIWGPVIAGGATVDTRVRWMLAEGTEPAAWAPAEGEEIAGGGRLYER